MKTAIIAVLLLFAVGAQAQTRGSVSDQQLCYQQARQYVADQTKGLTTSPAEPYTFEQAHYAPETKTCYVRYGHISNTFPADSNLHNVVYVRQILVADAFEGRLVAMVTIGIDQTNGYKESVYTSGRGGCQVNGVDCSSHAEFNGLLGKLVPALLE